MALASLAAVGVAGVVAASPAEATTCTSGNGCYAYYTYSGGATQAKITVDLGGSSTTSVTGVFNNPNGSQNCYYVIRPVDPPRNFYCNWHGNGKYTAIIGVFGNASPTNISVTHS